MLQGLKNVLFALALVGAAIMPRPVNAMDRNVRSVLIGGGYGLLGGTIVGLISYPLTRDARSIFIGSSVGLYLGIVVGAYNAVDRDNPDNPLRAQSDLVPRPGLGVSDLELPPSSRPDLAAVAPQAVKPGQKSGPPAWLELSVPVVRF